MRARIRLSRFRSRSGFEDNNSSPEFGPVMNSGEGRPTLSLPVIPPRLQPQPRLLDISAILHTPHHSSTPYRTNPQRSYIRR